MGIPSLFQYYYNKYKCENELMIDIEDLSKECFNHLFFDFNSLIHPCAQQILSINHSYYVTCQPLPRKIEEIERDIISNCLRYTRLLINQVLNLNKNIDGKTVYIMIDGVAPRSKMNQQRERRYKSEFFKVTNNEKSSLWDSNRITPGTSFMLKLKNSLENFVKVIKDDLGIHCIISDASDIGEGEHKIMKTISSLDSKSDKVCIYGLDADLIMLSLMKDLDIVLIRDNTFSNQLEDKKKIIDYLNIKSLKTYICKDLISLLRNNNLDSNSLINDYILICFLLGNDFLDHLPSLSIRKRGIDTIMKAYANAWKGKHLVNSTLLKDKTKWKECINLVYLKDIMYQLKNHEIYYFKKFSPDILSTQDETMATELPIDKVCFYKTDFIEYTKEDYKNRYYLYYGISDVHSVVLNYIEGLYWILGYYNGHIHNNWTWYYKYHNVPFCSDIFDVLLKTNKDKVFEYISTSTNLNNSTTFSSLKQLFMVLPKDSLCSILGDLNLDLDIYKYTLLKSKDYFPEKLYVDAINKRYLWQTKIFFDYMDDKIIDAFIT